MPVIQTLIGKGREETVPESVGFKSEDLTQKLLAMLPMFLGTTGAPANPWMGLLQGMKQWMVAEGGI
jgi:hypothetical protein